MFFTHCLLLDLVTSTCTYITFNCSFFSDIFSSVLPCLSAHCRMEAAASFMCDYWHYSIYFSTLYVMSIFALKHWMRDREKYDLRRPLFTWSLGLSLFSCLGVCRVTVPQIMVSLQDGFHYSACVRMVEMNLWVFLFALSKLPELVDTYFIVLRKQKLIFLHWYHHITVFVYCWFQYCLLYPPGQWFSAMNYFVHAIMYGYYAVRASGLYRPPIWVNIFITVLQLMQMLVGLAITLYVYNQICNSSWDCGDEYDSLKQVYLTLIMYLSYLVLFVNFFYTTYLCKSRPPKEKETPVASNQAAPMVSGIIQGFSYKPNSIHANGLRPDTVRHR